LRKTKREKRQHGRLFAAHAPSVILYLKKENGGYDVIDISKPPIRNIYHLTALNHLPNDGFFISRLEVISKYKN